MKYLIILTIGVCLLFASVPAMADQAADEAAIRKLMKEGPSSYNEGDADAFSRILDGTTILGFVGPALAKADRVKGYRQLFEKNDNLHYEQEEEIGLDFITSDVAIFRAKGEYTGGYDEQGKPRPPQKTFGSVICVKRNGEWLVSAVFERPREE